LCHFLFLCNFVRLGNYIKILTSLNVVHKHIRTNFPEIEVIVSYADPTKGHEGTIYTASNFKFVGTGAKSYSYVDKETGKIYHSRALNAKKDGELRYFARKLRAKLGNGKLERIRSIGKHCYVYELKNR
jgi:hypothetical protein